MSKRIKLPDIVVEEVVQIGDTFLIHFKCPYCGELNFTGHPPEKCTFCHFWLTDSEIDLKASRTRLIT